jgi:hypothetical protein
MSTRATILITYKAGNTVQLYHHCDGYPEYMGKLLDTFCNTAYFMRYGTGIDEAFYNLLKMEKHFEFEKAGLRHADIEYCWYVKLMEDGYDISYTEINPKFDQISEIENDEEREQKYIELFDEILSASSGEKLYA